MVGRVFMPIRGCNKFVANVIDQLHQNDSEFRLLKLDGSHTRLNFRKLIEAIDRNTTVTQVQIHGGLVANLPQREQHEIWNALGNLPNLEEADFKYFTEATLHLDGISCFVARAKGLRKLSLYDSELQSHDVTQGLTNLEQHTKLKTIFFSHLMLPIDRNFDPILTSLLSAPKLSNITIRIPRRRKNMIQTETLRALLRSKTLKVLELRRTVLTDDALSQLAEDLKTSKLQECTIQCDDKLRRDCCAALAKMLQENSTLFRLEVWGQAVDEEGFIEIVNALRENTTLKILHLPHDIQEAGHDALRALFLTNRTLETLYMRSFGHAEMMASTDYWLKLNSTKLRGLQLDLNIDRDGLVETMEKYFDLNHLYFLLRGNPNIIAPASQQQ